VDGYDNPRPITVQHGEQQLLGSDLVRGAAPTPDGGVLLLLDVERLHNRARDSVQLPVASSRRIADQRRALVVEDAPVARELLSGIVRSFGVQVLEATDGRQGLALARASRPDLVLTDVEMPYLDGIDMIAELRRSPGFERTPIIVLTTATGANNLARLEGLGVVAVLSKQRFVEADLRAIDERCLRDTAHPASE
jgi:two-component system chemotaxis sensor kinase CheA